MAEEQRLAAVGKTAERDFAQQSVPSIPASGTEAPSVAGDAAASPRPVEIRSAEDHLLQRCATTTWSPSKDSLFLTSSDSTSPGLEEFRSLRSRLFQMRSKKPLKRILISSALPSEGKSFVSANLAQAFARQRGGRTLLIDADLRKPHLQDVLGAPSAPGLYEYLSGKATESEVIQKSVYDDLFFIPAGKISSVPAELIGNGRMRHLLDILSPMFNWIVVDSSPVIPVSDATQLAELCDGVLLVLKAGSTPPLVAERAKKEFSHVPILGVVFNKVPRRENPYYRYAYSKGTE